MTAIARPSPAPDRVARLIVACTWAAMTLLLVVLFRFDSTNVPLAEDWYMVPAFTGHEPDFAGWLWSQNNEHRVPFPRLVYLGLLHLSGGSFVTVGWANLVLLAATAAGLIVFARGLRGHTDIADAFFPLQLLHWGHSVQLLLPFLISLVLPTVATLALLCAFARPDRLARRAVAVAAGAAIVSLPLCGFVGLLYVPGAAVLLLVLARGLPSDSRVVSPRRILVGASLLAVLVSGLYFIGYYTPWWNPPHPGWREGLRTALRVLAMGFGVAPAEAWRPFVLVTLGLMGATAGCVLLALRRAAPGERVRAWAFALFAANAVVFALAVGWSRSAWVPQFGIPSRYALFSIPAFSAVFLCWVLFARGASRIWVPRLLAVAMLALVPWNTRAGNTFFADWYREGMNAFAADVAAGLTVEELARKQQPFLFHALTPEVVATHMRRLQEAGVEPFDQLPPAPAAAETTTSGDAPAAERLDR